MDGRLALSFTIATFIAALGAIIALLNVASRLDKVESALGARPAGRPPGVIPPAPPGPGSGGDEDPLVSKDPLVKLDWLVRTVQELNENTFEASSDVGQSLSDLTREVRQIKGTLRQVLQGIGRTGGFSGVGGHLPARGTPLGPTELAAYREEAKKAGVRVEDGRVTVRGFLNMHPNRNMPIEYFITRWPESGHETLVHLVGDKDLTELGESPHASLRGLGTALYKGLVAAGFAEGKSSHADPDGDPRSPRWVLPTGDTVYVYARYERGGKTHVARATDWVLDPASGTVLPEDCFRFTGSARVEDPDTGEEVLAAEMAGLFVSVWPNATALIEVALDSAVHNDYQYNFERIPGPSGEGPLYLDVIFTKTRIDAEGDGALPVKPPSPRVRDEGDEKGDR
jgi:hypothetical protein